MPLWFSIITHLTADFLGADPFDFALHYKAQKIGKDTHFQLVEIKMKELIKAQEVYLVNAAYEFELVKMIPAKYIAVITAGRLGNFSDY